MNRKHGGKRPRAGRPKINGGVQRILITVTESHAAWLKSQPAGASQAIRALIDAAIRAAPDDAQRPDEQGGGDGQREKSG